MARAHASCLMSHVRCRSSLVTWRCRAYNIVNCGAVAFKSIGSLAECKATTAGACTSWPFDFSDARPECTDICPQGSLSTMQQRLVPCAHNHLCHQSARHLPQLAANGEPPAHHSKPDYVKAKQYEHAAGEAVDCSVRQPCSLLSKRSAGSQQASRKRRGKVCAQAVGKRGRAAGRVPCEPVLAWALQARRSQSTWGRRR
jgi:hypothetical protein